MAQVDLYVLKTASPNPVIVGQPLTFDVTVGNNGPEFATNAIVTDTLPSGICILDIAVSQGHICLNEDGIITWTIPIVNITNPVTMTIIAIPQQANIPLVNSAHVDPREEDEDIDPTNNDASVTVEVTPSADLLVIKDSCPVDAIRGNSVEYILTVINKGPSNAFNIVATDTLPTGITPILPLPSGCTYNPAQNKVICNITSLDADEIKQIRFSVDTANVEGPMLVNSVEVTSETPDPNPDNNEDDAAINVAPAADVSIVKTVSTDVAQPGEEFTYTLTVTNNGPSKATDVTVVDTHSPTVEVTNIDEPPGTTHIPPGNNPTGDTITFYLPNLDPGDTVSIEIEARSSAEGMVTNSAEVHALEADPNPCNNIDSVCTFIARIASTNISVTKTHTPDPAGLCSPVLYTITVTNNGDISATGVTLVDQLPSSLEIISINSTQGRCCICNDNGCQQPCSYRNKDCHKNHCDHDECYKVVHPCDLGCHQTPSSCQEDPVYEPPCQENPCDNDDNQESICSRINEIICQLGTLAPEASAIVQILVRPKIVGTITNTAIVTANETDSDTDDNVATDTLTVIPLCEQIDNLINMVNDMITNGDIEDTYGKILINILKKIKIAICCSSTPDTVCCNPTHEAKCDIVDFINNVMLFIEKDLISEELGCELIKAAKLIIEAVNCSDLSSNTTVQRCSRIYRYQS